MYKVFFLAIDYFKPETQARSGLTCKKLYSIYAEKVNLLGWRIRCNWISTGTYRTMRKDLSSEKFNDQIKKDEIHPANCIFFHILNNKLKVADVFRWCINKKYTHKNSIFNHNGNIVVYEHLFIEKRSDLLRIYINMEISKKHLRDFIKYVSSKNLFKGDEYAEMWQTMTDELCKLRYKDLANLLHILSEFNIANHICLTNLHELIKAEYRKRLIKAAMKASRVMNEASRREYYNS